MHLSCLQAQAEALVATFGMPADIMPLIRRLWLSHVPRTGLLDITLKDMWVGRWKAGHAFSRSLLLKGAYSQGSSSDGFR